MFANPRMCIFERRGHHLRIERGEPLERPQRMQARLREIALLGQHFEQRDRSLVLPVDQQALRRLPMPSIRARKLSHQLRRGSLAEIRFQIALPELMIGNDPVNPAFVDATPEIHFLLDLLGDGFRRLDELAIDVGDIQIAVRALAKLQGGTTSLETRNSEFSWRDAQHR